MLLPPREDGALRMLLPPREDGALRMLLPPRYDEELFIAPLRYDEPERGAYELPLLRDPLERGA